MSIPEFLAVACVGFGVFGYVKTAPLNVDSMLSVLRELDDGSEGKLQLARIVKLFDAIGRDFAGAGYLQELALVATSQAEEATRATAETAMRATPEHPSLGAWFRRVVLLDAILMFASILSTLLLVPSRSYFAFLPLVGMVASALSLGRAASCLQKLRSRRDELIVLLGASYERSRALSMGAETPFRTFASPDESVLPLPPPRQALPSSPPPKAEPTIARCIACQSASFVRTRFIALRGILPGPSSTTDFPHATCEAVVCRACGRVDWYVENPERLLDRNRAQNDAVLPQSGGVASAPDETE